MASMVKGHHNIVNLSREYSEQYVLRVYKVQLVISSGFRSLVNLDTPFHFLSKVQYIRVRCA